MTYFLPDGTQLTLDELQAQVRLGTLNPNRLVTPEGSQDAVQIREVLANAAKRTPPPLPRETPAVPTARTTSPYLKSPAPPLPQGQPAAQQATPKSGSLAWLWITLTIIGILMIGGIVIGAIGFKKMVDAVENAGQAPVPLLEDRAGHFTEWLDPEDIEFTSAGTPPEPPEDENLTLITYPSTDGDLAAYLTPDPGDGKKHPAMVWAKGGFGGISDFMWGKQLRLNDQSAREFRDAGIVLMCPSFRGENDNPGRFELFYGEVDDLLAAVEHVKTLPYVDPERVYIGGHSTGGTLALLAAVSGSETDFRAVFSFGGRADMEEIMLDGEGYGNTPYDSELSTRDTELRSATRYTKFIKRPTFYIEGEDSYYSDIDDMENRAIAADVPFEGFLVTSADHWSVLASSTRLIAQKILKDTGPECNITLSMDELDETWLAMNDVSLASELSEWLAKGESPAELAEILEFLDEDAPPASEEDLARLKTTIKRLIKDNSTEAINQLSDLIDLGYSIESDQITASFNQDIVPLFHEYLKREAQSKDKPDQDRSYWNLWIVATLVDLGDETSGELVAELIRGNFCEAFPVVWDDIFNAINPELPTYEPINAALRNEPPSGRIGERLLSWTNSQFFDDEFDQPHYFDSKAGVSRLKEWILQGDDDPNPNNAFGATIALGFMKNEAATEALELAYEHSDSTIRLEAAWSDLKSNEAERGLKYLQKAALNPDESETAKSYLIELDHEADIPTAALEPAFAAKATMIDWLQNGRELGGSPNSIKMIDSRILFWPPNDEKRTLRIFEFTYRFEESEPLKTSYGYTGGSSTWSSFSEFEKTPTPRELYAAQCAFELNWQVEEGDAEVTEADALKLLLEKNPEAFKDGEEKSNE